MGVESYEKEVIMDPEPIDRDLLEEMETQNRPEQRESPPWQTSRHSVRQRPARLPELLEFTWQIICFHARHFI